MTTHAKPTAPALVRVLTTMHDAWIIGSAALPDVTKPRDWDVLVPFEQWAHAMLLIRDLPYVFNTFGGFKVSQDGCSIDVWPGNLGDYMSRGGYARAAWHPQSGVRLVRVP